MKEITFKSNLSWAEAQNDKIIVDNKINNPFYHNVTWKERPLIPNDEFKEIICNIENKKSITIQKIKETLGDIPYSPVHNTSLIKISKHDFIEIICLNLLTSLNRFNYISQEHLGIIELEVKRALQFTLPDGVYGI